MLDTCNVLGAIVTLGGGGLLMGVSIGAFLFGSCGDAQRLERERRKRLDAVRRLDVALDDLHGVALPADVRRARPVIEGVRDMLDDPRT